MRRKQRLLLSLVVLIFSFLSSVTWARGPIVLDLNGFYYSDSVKRTTTETTTSMFWSAFFGFSVDNKGTFQAGWNYASFAIDEKETAGTSSYSSTQMGPGFIYYLDKGRTWRLFFAYNLETLADYKTPTVTSEEWSGTAMQADFGYHFEISEDVSLALRFNYVAASFTESKVGGTTTDKSYTRTHMYPSVALTTEF